MKRFKSKTINEQIAKAKRIRDSESYRELHIATGLKPTDWNLFLKSNQDKIEFHEGGIDYLLEESYNSGDVKKYRDLCISYGIEPIDWYFFAKGDQNKNSIFELENIEKFTYEERITAWELRNENIDNKIIKKNWGMLKKHLSQLSKNIAQYTYIGMFNMKIPIKLLDSLNQNEILGIYYGIGMSKEGGENKKFLRNFSEILYSLSKYQKEVDEKLVDFTPNYSYEHIFEFSSNKRKQHPCFQTIPFEDQQAFVCSFVKDYQPIKNKKLSSKKDFIDSIFDEICLHYNSSFYDI